jgi:hypothetical protein
VFRFKLYIADYAALIKVCFVLSSVLLTAELMKVCFVLSLIADYAALMVCFVYLDMEILNVP